MNRQAAAIILRRLLRASISWRASCLPIRKFDPTAYCNGAGPAVQKQAAVFALQLPVVCQRNGGCN
jgi:hypothetical protein